MKNVIIFAVEGERFAVELRWVREVITLGHVTRVPGAPVHVAGAVNVRGAITPVLDLGALPGDGNRARHAAARARAGHDDARHDDDAADARHGDDDARHGDDDARHGDGDRDGNARSGGDGAVLIDIEGVAMALRMNAVEEVSTVRESALSGPGDAPGALGAPDAPAGHAAVPGVITGAVVDSRGREVALIDPPELVRLTLALAHSKRELPLLPPLLGEP